MSGRPQHLRMDRQGALEEPPGGPPVRPKGSIPRFTCQPTIAIGTWRQASPWCSRQLVPGRVRAPVVGEDGGPGRLMVSSLPAPSSRRPGGEMTSVSGTARLRSPFCRRRPHHAAQRHHSRSVYRIHYIVSERQSLSLNSKPPSLQQTQGRSTCCRAWTGMPPTAWARWSSVGWMSMVGARNELVLPNRSRAPQLET